MDPNVNTHLFQFTLKPFPLLCHIPGGGEPLQSGAVRGGAGGQLSLHGLPQCDAEGDSFPRALCRAAHHVSSGRHRKLPPTPLLPFPCQTQVCDGVFDNDKKASFAHKIGKYI